MKSSMLLPFEWKSLKYPCHSMCLVRYLFGNPDMPGKLFGLTDPIESKICMGNIKKSSNEWETSLDIRVREFFSSKNMGHGVFTTYPQKFITNSMHSNNLNSKSLYTKARAGTWGLERRMKGTRDWKRKDEGMKNNKDWRSLRGEKGV